MKKLTKKKNSITKNNEKKVTSNTIQSSKKLKFVLQEKYKNLSSLGYKIIEMLPGYPAITLISDENEVTMSHVFCLCDGKLEFLSTNEIYEEVGTAGNSKIVNNQISHDKGVCKPYLAVYE